MKKNDSGGWDIDQFGRPIEDPNGVPILELDYERIKFQNDDTCKILVTTYAAGAQGQTFTAGKTLVFDNLPQDYVEQYQTEDRAHRIDNRYNTHHDIKYYGMESKYSDSFLNEMKKRYVQKIDSGVFEEILDEKYAKSKELPTAYEKFFKQGTIDHVHKLNLETQKTVFHLINDGIADENLLEEDQIEFSVPELM